MIPYRSWKKTRSVSFFPFIYGNCSHCSQLFISSLNLFWLYVIAVGLTQFINEIPPSNDFLPLSAPLLNMNNKNNSACGAGGYSQMLQATSLAPNICPITLEFNTIPAPAVLGASWLRLRGYGSDDEDEDDDDDEDGLGISTANKAKEAAKKRKKRGSQPKHPDLERIAIATMENLKSMNIDPNSKEGIKIKRRIRNRMSAQLHRERKKAYIGYLEGLVRDNEKNVSSLSKNLEKIYNDYTAMRTSLMEITEHTGAVDPRAVQLLSKFPAYVAIRPSVRTYSEADYTSVSNSTPSHTPSDSEHSYDAREAGRTASFELDPFNNDLYDDDWGNSNAKKLKGSFGQSVSMFSIAFLLAFSIFGGQNSLSSTLFPSFKHDVVPAPVVSFLESPESTWPVVSSNVPTLSNRLVVVTDNDDNESIARVIVDRRTQDDGYVATEKYPVVPTSSMSAIASRSASTTEEATIKSELPKTRYMLTADHALWKYQDAGLSLFPLNKYSTLATPSVNKSVLGKRRYLRSNKSHGTDNSTAENVYRTDPRTYTYDLPRLPMNDGSKSPAAVSHVLVTQGRALLDVNLASGLLAARASQQSARSVPVNEETASKAVAAWVSSKPAPPIMSTRSQVTSGAVVPVAVTMPTVSAPDAESNVLMMLMPASAVRWGKSWGDSASMASLFSTLSTEDGQFKTENISQDAFANNFEGVDGASGDSNMWIEIGCQVFRAQLVKNVTFS
jgi:hypothetical protein